MIIAAIVGSRKRSSVKGIEDDGERSEIQSNDKFLINQVISNLLNRYKSDLAVISCACDDGVGLIVKEICSERAIKCAEMVWYFHGPKKWEPQESSKCYLGRSPAIIELADVFAILVDDSRQGIAEDLLTRLRVLKQRHENMSENGDRPYVVLDDRGRCVEEYKKGALL